MGGRDHFEKLNARQREAACFGAGPLLILAGAGTGKTRTLAYRIAHLVERGVPGEEILAVAFTNKSADELKERVRRLLEKGRKPPQVSTFHSFCVRVLRREIERLGYKRNFTIYDTADQLSALKEVVKEVRLVGRGDVDAKRILGAISRAKNEGREPDPGDGSDPYAILAAEAWPRYEKALRAYNAVDFDDLLVLTLRLFRDHSEALETWRGRSRHVLVDEFQDTNAVQYRLVALLAGESGNLTVVGDDDQSIYGWRGALPTNILEFTREWPAAKVVTLDQNYRSTTRILAAANQVIRRNPGRREKNLWSELGEGPPVAVIACRDAEDEAQAVMERIVGLLSSGKAKPSDCAVIFRTNAQSRPFEDALRRQRLRYIVVGGMRFYDRKEVRDLLSYLAAIWNPRDEIALLRVVNFPARGIGHETIHKLQAASLAGKRPLGEVLAEAAAVPGVGERQARAIAEFVSLLAFERERFVPGKLAAAAEELVRLTLFEDAVRHTVKDPMAAERKVENVREVVAALAVFERENPEATLGEYLAGVNLSGREEEAEEFAGEAVTLLTMHSAKGLEYPHVFLAGMEEGLLPHKRSEMESGGLEEERRLTYVGMTRARQSLTLTHAGSRTRWSKQEKRVPSRFLDELPAEGVRREDRRSPSGAGEEEVQRSAEDFFDRVKRML
jgi:DNA helicase-2/ATP-dependent DNA helicase PcrA